MDSPCVVVAGAGIAGAIAACDLRRLGFEVEWLARDGGGVEGIEALSPLAVEALARLGLASSVAAAGAVVLDSFENVWDGELRRMRGPWLHVEREALARALRDEAVSRGARLRRVARLPRLVVNEDSVRLDDNPSARAFALDATGRVARWIGATERGDVKVVALFRGPASAPRPGRVACWRGGWAYALAHPEMSSIGVVAERRDLRELPPEVGEALNLPDADRYVFVRRGVAHAQWARAPVRGRLLAVGDAAFACEPLAGQGVHFAAVSAAAAAAALNTSRDARGAATARRYYEALVREARDRHLAHVERIAGAPPAAALELTGAPLAFAAEVAPLALRRGDVIVEEAGLLLPDGGRARWLGGFDLMDLRGLTAAPQTPAALRAALRARGLGDDRAESLLLWSLRHGVLAERRACVN